jgi:hypothetical protein
MSTRVTSVQFLITIDVEIDIPDGDPYQRTPEDFAEAALWSASLKDASYMDGWADLSGTARVEDIDAL